MKCDYCLTDHPRSTMTADKHGSICICCMAMAYYDGWDRRENTLTPEEMRSLYPERDGSK